MRRRARAIQVSILAVLLLLGADASARLEPIRRARWLMGTSCVGEAYGKAAAQALADAFDSIARTEARLSTWRDDSELSQVNRLASAGRQHLSPELAAFLDITLQLVGESDGAFDPTIGPLVRAWDLRGAGRIPPAGELSSARRSVGARHVHLDRAAATISFDVPGLWLDPGGIGKGWALDRAAEVLREHALDGALLDFGGQLIAVGTPPGARHWPVAVARPDDRSRPELVLALASGSVATSAQSQRGHSVGGRWLGHILDPRTGEPVARSGSVTVAAENATEADALATALFVMGPEAGLAWAKDHPRIGVGFLEPDGSGSAGRVWRLRANRRFHSMILAAPGQRDEERDTGSR